MCGLLVNDDRSSCNYRMSNNPLHKQKLISVTDLMANLEEVCKAVFARRLVCVAAFPKFIVDNEDLQRGRANAIVEEAMNI